MIMENIIEAVRRFFEVHGDDVCVIAIDGRAASGKTTLAKRLEIEFGAGVIHMDDFFLPPELRTEERLNKPGGNVHYERFAEEVLPNLHCPEEFSYGKFDCSAMRINGEVTVGASRVRVVEGSYAFHPYFRCYSDIRIFLDIEYEEQLRRIRERNGDAKLEIFKNRWIPLEEAYFKAYGIKEKANLIIN